MTPPIVGPRASRPPFLDVSRPIARRAVAAGLLWPTLARAQPEDTLARIRRTGRLRFAVVSAQPPYSYKEAGSGPWRGFLPDLAADLAHELGVEPAAVESTWGTGVLDLQAGKVDIFFGLAPTPQRALAVDFTHPFYQNAFALVARPGFNPRTWADLDKPEVRVALELGTSYDQAVPDLCPRATVTRLRTNNDALLMVQSGRADCQIIVIVFALTTLTRNPGLGHLIVPEPLYGATTNAIVAKEPGGAWRDVVDAWIDRRRTEGALRAALVRNLAAVGVPPESVPPQLLF